MARLDRANPASDSEGHDGLGLVAPDENPPSSTNPILVVPAGTSPGATGLAEPPRNNPLAADLLDDWGHRQVQGVVEGLDLTTSVAGSDSARVMALLAAASPGPPDSVAPELRDGDAVEVLGSRGGVTYGRWTGGPADTLSIDFDLSRANRAVRTDAAFRALLERAGKMWSRRIEDTWDTWERDAGDLKGWLYDGTGSPTEVRIGPGGEVSTGLVIAVRDEDLPSDVVGRGGTGVMPPGGSWEPRFGSVEVDRGHLAEAGAAVLFATLAHEIGHVLGVWKGGAETESYAPHTDSTTGTWHGPNVMAIHGGAAPFQDRLAPNAWVDGERSPLATEFDLAHSGVCISLMAYCRQSAAIPRYLPHEIDFAFLADLGMTIRPATDRPETYGLAGWTDHAGFSVSVSRDLEVALADPQPYYDGAANPWHALDVADLLYARVDVFGHRSTGSLARSFAPEGSRETIRYAGGLLGSAVDLAGRPPVTGDASLAVDLATRDGQASFTSLETHTHGARRLFAGGALHYPFELSANTLVGTRTGATLRADFYGPEHETAAGTLHDPRAGLLASFGATVDERPSREDVIARADYMSGLRYRSGAADPADDGWSQYRCDAQAGCESRQAASGILDDWTVSTRERVLASTAGWNGQSTARVDADAGFVRITRQSAAATDGAQGRHVADAYFGTLEHAAFGVGFEKYTDTWADSRGTPPGFENQWSGVQGAPSGARPGGRARWSGPMLGYQGGLPGGEDPFVEGLATVALSLAGDQLDVRFTGVASREGGRTLADFGFSGLSLGNDGTFGPDATGGIIDGALFGPAREEAAGSFHHNARGVTGAFGARRLADTVTQQPGPDDTGTELEETGTARRVGTTTYSVSQIGGRFPGTFTGTRPFYAIDNWGFWAKEDGATVFKVFIEENDSLFATDEFALRVEGAPTGSNPVNGSAVWVGSVRAYDVHPKTLGTPVNGDARIEADLSTATVDVSFTGFTRGHAAMSWTNLHMTNGTFSQRSGYTSISGAFYGTAHEGVAGTFSRDRLDGVFGANR